MNPLTPQQIRSSFVNASRREAAQATPPDLSALRWDRLDYLGWRDPKRPLLSYVVIELDDSPTGILLRASDPKLRRRGAAMCTWCEDVIETDDVALYVARRAGAAGRRGNTLGTMICTEFRCSANVRRKPTASEIYSDDPAEREQFVQRRIDGLRERSRRFARQVPDAS
jgi:FBP C-terminal treble-clef zinc-finger